MTLTTEPLQTPETTSPTPSTSPESSVRVRIGWAAVIAALAAAAVLAVSVLSPDSKPAMTPVWTGDTKDHPLYHQSPIPTGDTKDHPLYHQSPIPTGDTKDLIPA